MRANGAVVVVTGASAGVGRAVAHAFARRGARIGLIARDGRALDEVRREVEHLGGRGLSLPADVADADQVENAAERAEREFAAPAGRLAAKRTTGGSEAHDWSLQWTLSRHRRWLAAGAIAPGGLAIVATRLTAKAHNRRDGIRLEFSPK